jgi:hypothetical protein
MFPTQFLWALLIKRYGTTPYLFFILKEIRMLNCKCQNCCENVLKVTSISNTGGSFFFVTNSTVTPKNGCRYVIICPCSLLPTNVITTVGQVYAVVNGKNIPLQCVLGNNVYADQIKCFNVNNCGNIILRVVYGSTPTHFKIVSQKLCCSLAYGGTATATASATTTTADTDTENG